MDQDFVYSFPKSENEEIKFSIREYKGRFFIDLRLWFQGEEGGEWKPTKKGVFLAVEHFGELKKGVARLEQGVARLEKSEKVAA